MKYLFFIFLSVFVESGSASCVGLNGRALEQCHCETKYFKEKGPPEIAYKCRQKSDCIVVEGPCSDWMVLNKSWIKKTNFKSPNHLPSVEREKKPDFKCGKVNNQSRCVVSYETKPKKETSPKQECLKDPRNSWEEIPGGPGCVTRPYER